MVVLMHRNDMTRLALDEQDKVTLITAVDDGRRRAMSGFTVVPCDIPEGNIGGYYPECNALIPLRHHAEGSKTPAAKSIPVRVLREQSDAAGKPGSRRNGPIDADRVMWLRDLRQPVTAAKASFDHPAGLGLRSALLQA
jgi:hypothetical protein